MEHHGGGSHRLGRWLPHQDALEDWLEGLVKDIRAKRGGSRFRLVTGLYSRTPRPACWSFSP